MGSEKEKIIEEQLIKLKSDLPSARLLSDQDKKDLIKRIGPRTVASVVKARKELPRERIPFLFSSLDTQDVIDILENEWDSVLPN